MITFFNFSKFRDHLKIFVQVELGPLNLPDLSFSESEASMCYLIDFGLSGHVPGTEFQ